MEMKVEEERKGVRTRDEIKARKKSIIRRDETNTHVKGRNK